MPDAALVVLGPRGDYDLSRSARFQGCGTRRFSEGVLRLRFHAGGAPAAAAVRQRVDGRLEAQIAADALEAASEPLRFALAVDDDLDPFLQRAERDPLLGPFVPRLRGLRVLRLSTVAHALLRAFAGQLIQSSEARRIEYRVV